MLGGVIFDLGSTLIYSESDHQWGPLLPRMRQDLLRHLQACGYQLDPQAFLNRLSANYAVFDQQRQTDWVEYTTTYILQRTLAELDAPPPAPEVLAGALQAYYAYSETQWRVMPGAHATLSQLQAAGLRLAIISNAGDDGNVQRLIDQAGLRPYFDPILVSAAVGLRKPNPKIFERVLTAWGLEPAAGVMVGDTLGADILGAQLAGLRHVWLTAHADHAANQAHRGNIVPEAEVASLPELIPLLRAWGVPLPTEAG
jgi:putative hydrolase of the HAD superfamily